MKRTIRAQTILLLGCLLVSGCSRKTQNGNEARSAPEPVSTAATTPSPAQKFSDDELDELLAPIALYPDPLLAQIVPASTFIDQLEDANRTLAGKSDDNLITAQNWDVSVKSVSHYPEVLQMMVEKSDWTITLGQAYVTQADDVGKSIQRLRVEATAAHTLQTTSQQEVITEGQTIRIEPAQPQVIYVPQYDPEVVYVDNGPSTGEVVAASVISFGVGLAIGAWLNNDWDYHGRGVYYHGWSGGGWVGRNQTYVNVDRSFYVNNSFRNVNVNRTIVSRNTASYRTNLNRGAGVRRERVNAHRNAGRPGASRADATRTGALNTRDLNRPSANAAVPARGRANAGSAAGRSSPSGPAARSTPAFSGGGANNKANRGGGDNKSRGGGSGNGKRR